MGCSCSCGWRACRSVFVFLLIFCKQKFSIAVMTGRSLQKTYCTFSSPLVTSKHLFGFSHTFKYEPLKCQLFWRNSSLMKLKIGLQTPLILKLHLAAKLCVCDVIPSNLEFGEKCKYLQMTCHLSYDFITISNLNWPSNWWFVMKLRWKKIKGHSVL